MDKQKLEEMQEKVAKELDTQLSKALKNADEIWVPTAEFDSLTKALNEQRKQENEADRIEMERQKAEAEAELEMAKLDFEREKLAMESKLAKEKITDENRPDAIIYDFNELKQLFPKAPEVAWDKIRKV